jgi:hypothetical protein
LGVGGTGALLDEGEDMVRNSVLILEKLVDVVGCVWEGSRGSDCSFHIMEFGIPGDEWNQWIDVEEVVLFFPECFFFLGDFFPGEDMSIERSTLYSL